MFGWVLSSLISGYCPMLDDNPRGLELAQLLETDFELVWDWK